MEKFGKPRRPGILGQEYQAKCGCKEGQRSQNRASREEIHTTGPEQGSAPGGGGGAEAAHARGGGEGRFPPVTKRQPRRQRPQRR